MQYIFTDLSNQWRGTKLSQLRLRQGSQEKLYDEMTSHPLNTGQRDKLSFLLSLTLRRRLRRKVRMRWFFDVSKVKESSFLNRTSLTPHQIFDAHLLETTDLSPSRFNFSVGFRSRSCFESDGFIAYSTE